MGRFFLIYLWNSIIASYSIIIQIHIHHCQVGFEFATVQPCEIHAAKHSQLRLMALEREKALAMIRHFRENHISHRGVGWQSRLAKVSHKSPDISNVMEARHLGGRKIHFPCKGKCMNARVPTPARIIFDIFGILSSFATSFTISPLVFGLSRSQKMGTSIIVGTPTWCQPQLHEAIALVPGQRLGQSKQVLPWRGNQRCSRKVATFFVTVRMAMSLSQYYHYIHKYHRWLIDDS